MKTVSISVSESDYEVFRRASLASDRSIAQLIREAMALFREERLDARTPLLEVPALAGHRALTELPSRTELYDEVFAGRSAGPR